MSHLKFYPVGSTVEYGNVTLNVVTQKNNLPSCAGCYFSDHEQDKRGGSTSCYSHGIACTAHVRKDHRHIILKEPNNL